MNTVARLTTAQRMSRDLIRWQATHLARALWRLATGLIQWQSATLNTVDATSSDGTRTTGSAPHPQYLEIYVPEALQNGWEEHNLMLMHQDWDAAMTGMSELERTEWTKFLFTERPSDLYRLKIPYVWRNEVPLELCECACRMVGYCQIIYFLPEFVLECV